MPNLSTGILPLPSPAELFMLSSARLSKGGLHVQMPRPPSIDLLPGDHQPTDAIDENAPAEAGNHDLEAFSRPTLGPMSGAHADIDSHSLSNGLNGSIVGAREDGGGQPGQEDAELIQSGNRTAQLASLAEQADIKCAPAPLHASEASLQAGVCSV